MARKSIVPSFLSPMFRHFTMSTGSWGVNYYGNIKILYLALLYSSWCATCLPVASDAQKPSLVTVRGNRRYIAEKCRQNTQPEPSIPKQVALLLASKLVLDDCNSSTNCFLSELLYKTDWIWILNKTIFNFITILYCRTWEIVFG